jgi:hypothetical protein
MAHTLPQGLGFWFAEGGGLLFVLLYMLFMALAQWNIAQAAINFAVNEFNLPHMHHHL